MNLLPRWALLGQTIIAAGTFLVAKDATERFTPFQVVWFRIMLSGVLALGVYALTHSRPRISRGDWGRLAILGVMGVSLNQGFFLYGISMTTPLHASLLYAFTPVLVLLASAVWLSEDITLARGLGIGLSVAGVLVVLAGRGLDLTAGPMLGDLFVLIAVCAWAGYTILGKDVLRRLGTFTVITGAFLFGALTMLPFAPVALRGFDWSSPGLAGWAEIAYLSVITSGVAFTLWYWALKRLDASQTAVFNNLQPLFTATLAWAILGDVPGWQLAAGGVLVLAGVSLAQLPRR